MSDKTLCELPKNSREAIRFRLGEYKGHKFIDMRVFAIEDGKDPAPTGSGKTILALNLIVRRGQPTLIVVHTKELMDQWGSRIATFLGTPAREAGVIGNGKKRIGAKITVALVQSLYKCAGEVAPHVGHLVVDECHRAPSRTFTEAVTAFDCRLMLGLSATPWRRDGLSWLIYWHLGEKVHEVDKDSLVEAGHILLAEVIWRETDYEPTFDPDTSSWTCGWGSRPTAKGCEL